MNDEIYIRSVKDLGKDGNKATMTVSIHPTSKWLLRTVLENMYAENDEQLVVQIGESVETLNMMEYKQLQQDLIAMGYSKDEVCRGIFDEDPVSDNMCRSFKA